MESFQTVNFRTSSSYFEHHWYWFCTSKQYKGKAKYLEILIESDMLYV